MPNLNVRIFQFINGGAGQYIALDWFFIVVTSYFVYLVVAAVAGYILLVLPLRNSATMPRLRALAQGAEIVAGVSLTAFVVWITKIAVALPRPFVTLQNIDVLTPISGTHSFPSMHSALTCTIATAVYFYHPRLGKLLFIFAFIVGLSRIFVGVHYPLDVGVGLLLGYVIPKLVHKVFTKRQQPSVA